MHSACIGRDQSNSLTYFLIVNVYTMCNHLKLALDFCSFISYNLVHRNLKRTSDISFGRAHILGTLFNVHAGEGSCSDCA